MYRCPKCKKEYDERMESCRACGSSFIGNDRIEEDEVIEYDKEILLINVANEIQASMIESMLKDYNIPVLKKHKGAGAYLNMYMGASFCGVDLYVPSKLYESAKELIKEIEPEEEILEPDEEMDLERASYYRKRSIKVWFIILLFIPGLLIILAVLARVLIDLAANL